MRRSFRIVISIVLFHCIASNSYAGEIEQVSVSSSGEQGNNASSRPAVSADGRFVAFLSDASNLVANDTNDRADVFVHDRSLGTTDRVNVSSSGEQANDPAEIPVISADGRYIAFYSEASNHIENDTNGAGDIFVHDRNTGMISRISVSSSGLQGNSSTRVFTAISANGRFVAFSSRATNLVENDVNGVNDVFIHDRETAFTQRVSISSSGEQGNGSSFFPSISADGRYIAFSSSSTNLVEDDTNGVIDIFVHDRNTGTTELISQSTTGVQANDSSSGGVPAISADGRFVAFPSRASNLVGNDTNGASDVFVHDRNTGQVNRISLSSSGTQGNNSSGIPAISADGRFVTFNSVASNLVEGDVNGVNDVFVYDRSTEKTALVSLSATGELGNGFSGSSAISGDNRLISFSSWADNLVEADNNTQRDVFVADNPLINVDNDQILVEKLINNEPRQTPEAAAQLRSGSYYTQAYKVTNNSSSRIYQVNVFEGSRLVCKLYALNPGQSRQRCHSLQSVLEGDQHTQVKATAKVSGSSEVFTANTNAYYTGLVNASASLAVTHRINNINADRENQAPLLTSSQATISFKVENTGEIELYRTKVYHDPVSPVNSGWSQQCVIGILKPGQIRYCKRDIVLTESGLNKVMGRAQAAKAIIQTLSVVNAANPTYFIAP